VIAIDGAHLSRPGIEQHEIAACCAVEEFSIGVDERGRTPKSGLVAEPGFRSVAPGSGEINAPPVSVCHQVSTIGQRSLPTTR